MSKIRRFIRGFGKDEAGSNALEYGLIVGLVSLAVVGGATAAGNSLGNMFGAISARIAGIIVP